MVAQVLEEKKEKLKVYFQKLKKNILRLEIDTFFQKRVFGVFHPTRELLTFRVSGRNK